MAGAAARKSGGLSHARLAAPLARCARANACRPMLLVAPGLLPHAAHARILPTLARLAHYAAPPRVDQDGLAHLVCALAGMTAPPPIGALLAAGARVPTGTDYWLVADPVTLLAGRADVTLAAGTSDLERAETDELLTALNAHFHEDGLLFVAP